MYDIQMMFLIFISIVYFFKQSKLKWFIYYTSLVSIIASFKPEWLLPSLNDNLAMVVQSSFTVKGLLFFLTVMMIPRSDKLLDFVTHLAFFNSLWLIVARIFIFDTGNTTYGIALASTTDAQFIAICYPLIWSISDGYKNSLRYLYRLIPIIAILITTSSIGIGALIMALYLILSRDYVFKELTLIICLGLLTVAYFSIPGLFNDSNRFVCWVWSMDWWYNNANLLFGTGAGSYAILGRMIQVMTGNDLGNWYTMMHNDWLQCLFELGIIGFIITFIYFVIAMIKCFKSRRYHIFNSSLIYAVTAFMNPTTKYPVMALLGVLLIKDCLYDD